MTFLRATADRDDHTPISSIERKHPVHSRVSGWITQIFTHGLSISARCQTGASVGMVLSLQMAQTIQRALQDISGGNVVNDFCAAFA